jgi:hypothetical protein
LGFFYSLVRLCDFKISFGDKRTAMKKRSIVMLFIAIFTSGLCPSLLAAQGPVQSPLRVTAMYTTDNVYVQFQSGAMPGCYANAGGYLLPSTPNFKEIYAQLLMLTATGGQRATIIYTQHVQTGNWGDCTIDGIYLLPE